MDTKKRNIIIGAGATAAVILVIGLLTVFGVFRGFNPEGYVKAVLDQSLKGEVKVAAQLMDGTTEDALYKQYEAGITSFVENSIANGAGVKTVFVPEKNVRDVEEISTEITEGLEIIPVSHMTDVLKTALVCEE